MKQLLNNNPYQDLSDAAYAQLATAEHRPPSASQEGSNCVTVAVVLVDTADGPQYRVSLQDDKLDQDERRARTQVYDADEWRVFLADAKAGKYDDLAALADAGTTAAVEQGEPVPAAV